MNTFFFLRQKTILLMYEYLKIHFSERVYLSDVFT